MWQCVQHSAGWHGMRNFIRPYSHISSFLREAEALKICPKMNIFNEVHLLYWQFTEILMLLFLNKGWKWDCSFLPLSQSPKCTAHPAWGRVHITKSNEVLLIIYSKTGCSLRLTGNVNHMMHCGLSVSQKPCVGFCCCFLQTQSNLWKTDVSEIPHVKLQAQEIHITIVLLSKCAHRANNFIIIL